MTIEKSNIQKCLILTKSLLSNSIAVSWPVIHRATRCLLSCLNRISKLSILGLFPA